MRNNPIKQLSEEDLNRKEIKLQKIKNQMNPEHEDYRTAAQRPAYSVLNKAKIKADFDIEIPHWRVSLKECLSKIKNI